MRAALLRAIAGVAYLSGCSSLPAPPEKMRILTLDPRPPAVVLTSAGQSPPIMKLRDRYWVVTHPFKYQILNTSSQITIPKGFVTDLASIPGVLWSFGLDPTDTYLAAAVIHDYLYWDQRCEKEQADDILRLAMIESEVPGLKRWIVYQGVYLFGAASYAENARLKQSKKTRFFTADYTDALMNSSITGESTMNRLMSEAQKVHGTIEQDESNPDVSSFCKKGVDELAKL